MTTRWIALFVFLSTALSAVANEPALEIAGVTVTPHVKADSMRYKNPPPPAVGARVQLFLRNGAEPLRIDSDTRLKFNGDSPGELLESKAWAWHDTPSATPDEHTDLPAEALTVWTFNGRAASFGPGSRVHVEVGPGDAPFLNRDVALDTPELWLSAVTFLGPDDALQPDTIVVHIANDSDVPAEIRSCRLWLPRVPKMPRVLFRGQPMEPLAPFNGQATIPAGDRGGFVAKPGPLPLTYTVLEVTLAQAGRTPITLWSYLRIKPERFDISGGWVNSERNPVANEVFLKALKRLYVNTAHLSVTPGYSDTDLYTRYPLKYFGRMTPFETFDTDEMLPRIHAVEFLGEPQYGGGEPMSPQEVWDKLHPYATTRLATTVTHSEESVWRDYAGLSDYPHYDAYRVTAPSADKWRKYERWGRRRIAWGAPLETVGDMCRSLREMNRPMPCAIWSQGPHADWEVYGGRKRTSPTDDEIRLQAYHALSTRVTSLYWFNLSLESLVEWRDTLDEVGRIGREMRLLDEYLLEGDAYVFERLSAANGKLDWDIASVCGPRAALLFAMDLAYGPDRKEKVFKFGPPRPATWRFRVPAYLGDVADVFRVDSEGIHETTWVQSGGVVEIRENMSRVAVYFATPDKDLRNRVERERQQLLAAEAALQFDPATSDADFAQLKQLAGGN